MVHVGDMVEDRADILARFGATFGLDPWTRRAEGWTLIGFDATAFGDDVNGTQALWLQSVLEGTTGPVGLFLHYPWYRSVAADGLPTDTRHLLERLFDGHDLRFVMQGHSHMLQGSADAYVPAIGFVEAGTDGAVRLAGLARVTLDAAGHRIEHLAAPIRPSIGSTDRATHFDEQERIAA